MPEIGVPRPWLYWHFLCGVRLYHRPGDWRQHPPMACVGGQSGHTSLASPQAGGRSGLRSHLKAPLGEDPVWLWVELLAML